MAEFQTIETQEQLDAIIKGRLDREIKKHSETTAELQSQLDLLKASNDELVQKLEESTTKYAEYDKTILELNGKVAKYESDSVKTRICKEVGIPFEMMDRLKGDTEDEIRKDALEFLNYLPKKEAPLRSTATADIPASSKELAITELVRKMNEK